MVAFLIVDRFFAWTSPLVAICYECQHLHRGLSRQQLKDFPYYDLEVSDRLKLSAEAKA